MSARAPQACVAETLARAAHSVGLAALIGGSLFERVAVEPSLREISARKERGGLLNAARGRYAPIDAAATAAVVLSWTGSRLSHARPRHLSPTGRQMAIAKDAAVGAVAATGVASAVADARFAALAADGRVPLKVDGDPTKRAPEGARRLRRAATALRTAHLVAALTLAVTDGAFAHTSRTSPKRRRG